MANITEIAPIVSAAFSLITTVVVVFFGRKTAQQIEKIKIKKDTLNIKLEKLQNAFEQSRTRIDLRDTQNIFNEIQKQYYNTQDKIEIVKHFIERKKLDRVEEMEEQIRKIYISQANEKLSGKNPTPVDAQILSEQMANYHQLVSKILVEEMQAILSKLEA